MGTNDLAKVFRYEVAVELDFAGSFMLCIVFGCKKKEKKDLCVITCFISEFIIPGIAFEVHIV